jgi:hypothetical protein
MSTHIEKLKKQLIEISEVVNSFKSEAVQVKIIEKLFDAMNETAIENGNNASSKKTNKKNGYNYPARKKLGATKILNQLLSTDFFDAPQSISSIANFCKNKFNSNFKTSELSGILLKFAKESKLRRERNNDNNRFEYVRA